MDWFPFTFETIIGFALFAGLIALGGFFIYAYWRTRNPGFLWLLIAAVIWPYIYRIANRLVFRQMIGRQVSGMHGAGHFLLGMSAGGFYTSLLFFNELVRVATFAIAALYLLRHLPRADRKHLK